MGYSINGADITTLYAFRERTSASDTAYEAGSGGKLFGGVYKNVAQGGAYGDLKLLAYQNILPVACKKTLTAYKIGKQNLDVFKADIPYELKNYTQNNGAAAVHTTFLAVLIGGGGGGGRALEILLSTKGGGGGGGGFVMLAVVCNAGDIISYTAGAGGAMGEGAGNDGNDGGDSVLYVNGAEVARAYGGGRGKGGNNAEGGGETARGGYGGGVSATETDNIKILISNPGGDGGNGGRTFNNTAAKTGGSVPFLAYNNAFYKNILPTDTIFTNYSQYAGKGGDVEDRSDGFGGGGGGASFWGRGNNNLGASSAPVNPPRTGGGGSGTSNQNGDVPNNNGNVGAVWFYF
ncbi:MAG: hypothetical protein LBP79_06095 [Clostridiales bacterium]|jgi:hypothetical protein|nr:hypothetical protein [Clostridiales bacterium]